MGGLASPPCGGRHGLSGGGRTSSRSRRTPEAPVWRPHTRRRTGRDGGRPPTRPWEGPRSLRRETGPGAASGEGGQTRKARDTLGRGRKTAGRPAAFHPKFFCGTCHSGPASAGKCYGADDEEAPRRGRPTTGAGQARTAAARTERRRARSGWVLPSPTGHTHGSPRQRARSGGGGGGAPPSSPASQPPSGEGGE